MRVALTGHRYPRFRPGSDESLCTVLDDLGVTEVYDGMAIGFDQWALESIFRRGLDIRTIACVPFLGQESRWPAEVQRLYGELLARVDRIVITGQSYSPKAMKARNRYMVDNSDLTIAWFDGSPGGTANAIEYARQQNKQVINLYQGG